MKYSSNIKINTRYKDKKIRVCHSPPQPTIYSVYFACLSVCLYPINVKTAEPIRFKFWLGLHMTPGKFYKWIKFLKFASNKIGFSLNLHENPRFFLINPQTFFWGLFYNVHCVSSYYAEINFFKIFILQKSFPSDF